jgi:transposase-like protein
MAKRRKSAKEGAPAETTDANAASESPVKRAPRTRRARKVRAARKKSTPRKKRAPRRRARARYTEAKRQQILSTASKEGLTALEVQKRFGVTPVTYYSWRKKRGAGRARGRRGRPPGNARGGDLASQLRAEVQRRIREMMPSVVNEELQGYLSQVLGRSSRRR